MAFVASQQVVIATGAGTVTTPVPRVVDASGNGYNGNLFSHYMYVGVPWAIDPQDTSVTVAQGAADQILYFGSMQS